MRTLCFRMPPKHPRIASAADPELGEGLAHMRAADGRTNAELEAGRHRRAAAEALFEAMDGEQFDFDPAGECVSLAPRASAG